MESLLLEGKLGSRLFSIFGNEIDVMINDGVGGGRSGFWSKGDGRLRNGSLSELSLNPSDSLFKLGRLQWNAQIVTVNIPSTLSSRTLVPDQRVRGTLRALASEFPTPRELLASPPPSFGDRFTRALGDVHVSHRKLFAFLEVVEGDQGEFGRAGFVE